MAAHNSSRAGGKQARDRATDQRSAAPLERRVYVFLSQRRHDREAWPLVYDSRELAERAPHRCSEVVEVSVTQRGGA